MSEPSFSLTADDDLPRTIRREREAREREARDREARERQAAVSVPLVERERGYDLAAPATVTAIDVPFPRLVLFFIRAVFAAVPALLVLTVLLWLFGQGLQSLFPQLLKLKIDIQIYAPQSAADFRQPPRAPR